MRDERARRHRPGTASLEAALRGLPRPTVPEDLPGRLIAAIPVSPGAARDRSARLAPTMAVAAALVVATLLIRPRPDLAGARPMPSGLADTSTCFILEPALTPSTEETRPCDILPPLPSW